MSYSAGAQVIPLSIQTAAESIVELDVGIDLSAASADHMALAVPLPLMIYAFGFYITESLAAAVTGSLALEHSNIITGTAVQIVDFDLNSTTLKSGNGISPLQVSRTGSYELRYD